MQKKYLRDVNLVSVTLVNLFMLFLAIFNNINFLELFIIYVFQAGLIGVLHFIEMISLKNYYVENFFSQEIPSMGRESKKSLAAVFFFIHYGMFLSGFSLFFLFEIPFKNFLELSFLNIFLGILLMSISYIVSFSKTFNERINTPRHMKRMFFSSYIKAVPILIICFVGYSVRDLNYLLFLLLVIKLFVDVFAHILEEKSTLIKENHSGK